MDIQDKILIISNTVLFTLAIIGLVVPVVSLFSLGYSILHMSYLVYYIFNMFKGLKKMQKEIDEKLMELRRV